MSFLVDTNVLSELRKPNADPNVSGWAQAHPVQAMSLSVLTLGEIRKGVEQLGDHPKSAELTAWLTQGLPTRFAGRILAIDNTVADQWGTLLAHAPRTLPAIDSLIAATAIAHGLTLVTRNTKDFIGIAGLSVLNPWEPSA